MESERLKTYTEPQQKRTQRTSNARASKKDGHREFALPDPSTVTNPKEAYFRRMQCIRELTKLMGKLNDTTVPEGRLRSYNDQVNKLLRTKSLWSRRLIELGGRIPLPKDASLDDELRIDETYRYFGLAKFLPGVQDLLKERSKMQEEAKEKERSSRAELYRNVSFDYFQFEDTIANDPALALMEAEAEQAALAALSKDLNVAVEASSMQNPLFTRPFPEGIPTQEQVVSFLLHSKKQELLRSYT